MILTREKLRKIIGEALGDITTPAQLQQHVFPDDQKPDTRNMPVDLDYYHIETIVMTVGKLMPEGFTVNDVFDYIYRNRLEPYTQMSFDELHQVCVDLARDRVLEGYEDFFMLMPDFL
jgi:hypothetical protein